MYMVFRLCNARYDEREAHWFPNRIEAVSFLQRDWEDYLNTALAEARNPVSDFELGEIDMEETYHEDDYGIVQDECGDHTEWFLTIAE